MWSSISRWWFSLSVIYCMVAHICRRLKILDVTFQWIKSTDKGIIWCKWMAMFAVTCSEVELLPEQRLNWHTHGMCWKSECSDCIVTLNQIRRVTGGDIFSLYVTPVTVSTTQTFWKFFVLYKTMLLNTAILKLPSCYSRCWIYYFIAFTKTPYAGAWLNYHCWRILFVYNWIEVSMKGETEVFYGRCWPWTPISTLEY